MTIIVCQFCDRVVRLIRPLKNSSRVKGVCRQHAHLLTEKTVQQQQQNQHDDWLADCLKPKL